MGSAPDTQKEKARVQPAGSSTRESCFDGDDGNHERSQFFSHRTSLSPSLFERMSTSCVLMVLEKQTGS